MQTASTEEVNEAIDRDDVAVVNVLSAGAFEEEHIPNSINIPEERAEEEFPARFDRADDIIVYCGSEQCQASPRTAKTLNQLGFENVKDYEPGLAGWKDTGHETNPA